MLADGLIDGLHLFVYPLTRGEGPRLFPADAAAASSRSRRRVLRQRRRLPALPTRGVTREGWVDERLAARGIGRTGELELVRERPWAAVLRAPTTAGAVWLKAAGAATASRRRSTSCWRRWSRTGSSRRSASTSSVAGSCCPTAGPRWATG